MFITLTRLTTGKSRQITVNTDHLVWIEATSGCTHLGLAGESQDMLVTETPEEIVDEITRREEHQLRQQGLLPGNRPGR